MLSSPFVVGNWKMNTTVSEAVELAKNVRSKLDTATSVTKILCPPFVSLAPVHNELIGTTIHVGAQNMHYENKGAFTGEIAPTMLVDLCSYVIVGHSERRQYFQETNEIIKKKLLSARSNSLTPILCVGETLDDKESGNTRSVIFNQITSALSGEIGISGNLIVAYEPVWAIGTGRAADANTAQETMSYIRTILADLLGSSSAKSIPLLYGGSVSQDNVSEFAQQIDIDGALVGGASLDADHFTSIAKIFAAV